MKCIESIKIKKNGLKIFKFQEPTWGEGGMGGPAELVKSQLFEDFYSAQQSWSESRSGNSVRLFVCPSIRLSVTTSPPPPSCLNGGSYDQNEENRHCLTFWVDSKIISKIKKQTQKPPKRPPENTKNLNRGSYDKFE